MTGLAEDIKHESEGIERELKRITPLLLKFSDGTYTAAGHKTEKICRLLREAKETLMEIEG